MICIEVIVKRSKVNMGALRLVNRSEGVTWLGLI